MRTFVLHLQGATQYERFDDVTSFVGRDASGSFGILAGHGRMMTSLGLGLARFQLQEADWRHLALAGGLLYMVNNELFINTRRYVHDPDYRRVSRVLEEQLLTEETSLTQLKESAHRLEEEMLKRLWKLGRGEEAKR